MCCNSALSRSFEVSFGVCYLASVRVFFAGAAAAALMAAVLRHVSKSDNDMDARHDVPHCVSCDDM